MAGVGGGCVVGRRVLAGRALGSPGCAPGQSWAGTQFLKLQTQVLALTAWCGGSRVKPKQNFGVPPCAPLSQNKQSSESAVSSTVNPLVIHKRSKVKTEAEGLRPASPLTLTQVTCRPAWPCSNWGRASSPGAAALGP